MSCLELSSWTVSDKATVDCIARWKDHNVESVTESKKGLLYSKGSPLPPRAQTNARMAKVATTPTTPLTPQVLEQHASGNAAHRKSEPATYSDGSNLKCMQHHRISIYLVGIADLICRFPTRPRDACAGPYLEMPVLWIAPLASTLDVTDGVALDGGLVHEYSPSF